jgi:hypothetical protein
VLEEPSIDMGVVEEVRVEDWLGVDVVGLFLFLRFFFAGI